MDLQKLARYKELLLNRKKTSEPAEGYDSAVRPKGQSEQGGGPEAVIGIDIGNQSGCAALFKTAMSINLVRALAWSCRVSLR
ncbi:MAG: hypothetical protein IPP97_06265 [Candidatus Obscuribacter sp.]|nr:hypothetical protein [Candidatus Obscuribacter sp.]